MQCGSPPISPFAAIENIEKSDLTSNFFSSLLDGDNLVKSLIGRAIRDNPGLFRPIWHYIFPFVHKTAIYPGSEYGDRAEAFKTIFNQRRWISDESVSGYGSTLKHTSVLRERLPQLLIQLEARTFLDAPCGDFNWMRRVELPRELSYIGGDIVEAIVQSNEAKYSSPVRAFVRLDIVDGKLPSADLWLCRHVLFHLSNADILAILRNFALSDVNYILTDSVPFVNAAGDIRSGGFRLVNLRKPPFSLPKPILRIPDFNPPEPPNFMNLWSRHQVRKVLGV